MVAAEQVDLAIESCLVLFGITYQEEYCVVLLDFLLLFLVCGFCSVQTRQWILLSVGSSSFRKSLNLSRARTAGL